jgi:hypothetical protein
MSLLGAIATYADEGTEEEVVALRTALGSSKIWADVVPAEISFPFIALSETNTRLVAERKGTATKVVDITVTYDVSSESRASVEQYLELLEDAFAAAELTMPEGQRHLKTTFGNRYQTWKEGLLWSGTLELVYTVEK